MNGHPERENCREADERQARTRAEKAKTPPTVRWAAPSPRELGDCLLSAAGRAAPRPTRGLCPRGGPKAAGAMDGPAAVKLELPDHVAAAVELSILVVQPAVRHGAWAAVTAIEPALVS